VATWLVPAGVLTVVGVMLLLARLRPAGARLLRRAGVGLWLVAAGALLSTLMLRPDTVVEIEDPQVRHLGGTLDPPPGTFLRYLQPNGWRLANGDAVEIPFLPGPGGEMHLTSRVEGPVDGVARLLASWPGRPTAPLGIDVPVSGEVRLPPPPASGRLVLRLTLQAPAGTTVVLDRVDLGPTR
jgi:hypothetical protein